MHPSRAVLLVVLAVCSLAAAPGAEQTGLQNANRDNTRYLRGRDQLKVIDGEAGERVVEQLEAFSPDLGRYLLEYAFGDVYARPGLDVKAKELSVVAALTAMGTAAPQLKVHLHAALHVGCTVQEIQEAILQMSAYAGFPAALNAMSSFRAVLIERGMSTAPMAPVPSTGDRLANGEKLLAALDPNQRARLQSEYGTLSPDLLRYVIEFGYGDILARPGLPLARRELITIAALTAMGTAPAQLRFHINGGLNAGLPENDIREVIILMTVYAGFPAALNATTALKDVLAARR